MATQKPYRRSPEQLARDKTVREAIQKEKPTLQGLVESGHTPIPLGEYAELARLARALREARETSGMSLADVADRSGIDRGALSRLENGHVENPTLNTLTRYLKAIGKKLIVSIGDEAST